jgi:anti-sigma-K factor RskA
MTDPHDTPERDDPDLLAAEYVLGVLPLSQRAGAEARLKTDRDFAQSVTKWEARLSGLNDGFEEAPAPDLMPRIEARLFGVPAVRKPFWRSWFAGAAVAAALGVAVLVVLPAAPPPTAFTPVAVLGADDQPLRYDVAIQGENLRLSRVAGAAASAGQVHELWLIAGSGAPVSLGLLTADEVTLPVPAGFAGGAVLAISLEPEGGSPTGAPTGPVLVTGVVS